MNRLLFLPLLMITATRGMENDFGKEMFSRSFQSVDECYKTQNECNICYSQCPRAHSSFFSNPSNSPTNISAKLRTCRIGISNQRTGMNTWCVNDWSRFYATRAFQPTEKSCWMRQTDCAEAVINAVKRRQSPDHPNYILAQKMASLGLAYQDRRRARERHVSQRNKYEKLNAWFQEDVLAEMKIHLKNPARNDTRWSDPVYNNLTEVKKEVVQINTILSLNNLQKVQEENQDVRLRYARRSDRFMHSIANLQNHIVSNKEETDEYLKEIKQLAVKTFEAQLKSANFAYETTHSYKLDGEIVLLDKELFQMFKDLRNLRSTLGNILVYSTLDKLKLVGGMRMMIKAITLAQKSAGCPPEELITA